MYGELKRQSILSSFSNQKKIFNKKEFSLLGNLLIKSFIDKEENVFEKAINNNLEKSYIIEAFGAYSTNKLVIKKKGKEIKTKLPEIKVIETAEKEKYYSEMEALKKEIGVEPKDDFEEYIFKGTKGKLISIPKEYSWEQRQEINPVKKEFSSLINLSEVKVDSSEHKFYKYNNLARKYISCCVEIAMIDTLINVLSDDKEYELGLEQLTALNF